MLILILVAAGYQAMSDTVAECRCLQDPIPGKFLRQGAVTIRLLPPDHFVVFYIYHLFPADLTLGCVVTATNPI